MFFYICCTQEDNECPRREECRRYLNANEGTSWTLFKYVCTEENNYHLFMKQDDNIVNNDSIKEKNENEEEQTND